MGVRCIVFVVHVVGGAVVDVDSLLRPTCFVFIFVLVRRAGKKERGLDLIGEMCMDGLFGRPMRISPVRSSYLPVFVVPVAFSPWESHAPRVGLM